MDKIIVLPGNISSNFFTNELEYIKKYFEIVAVIAYKEPDKRTKHIISQNHLYVRQIKNIDLKVLFSTYFWKWLFCKDTIEEIKSNIKKKHSLKRLSYIIYYGCFCTQVCKVLDELLSTIKEEDTVCFYSYWLSRSAYAISYYHMMHLDNQHIRYSVSRAHRYDLYEERNQYHYLPFRKTINKYLDIIAFISVDGKRYFNDRYPFSNKGALKEVYQLGTYNKNEITKTIHNKNTICVVSCSAVRKVKRLDLIINLMAQIEQNVKWVHIGDGELLDEIKAYTEKILPPFRYTFVGQIDNDKILAQYEKYDADFFINLSDSEGIPVSVMEAMSYGIPCIGRNVGGMSEIINEETGLLLEKVTEEVEIVKRYIDIRLHDIDRYKTVSDNCRKKWKMEYNADKNYENFFEALKNRVNIKNK